MGLPFNQSLMARVPHIIELCHEATLQTWTTFPSPTCIQMKPCKSFLSDQCQHKGHVLLLGPGGYETDGLSSHLGLHLSIDINAQNVLETCVKKPLTADP